jgi:hypothetical protein
MAYRSERSACIVALTSAALEPRYREAYDGIVGGNMSADRAQNWLAQAGIRVSATSIRKHRGGYCSCPPER